MDGKKELREESKRICGLGWTYFVDVLDEFFFFIFGTV